MVKKVTTTEYRYVGISDSSGKLVFSNNISTSKQYHKKINNVVSLPKPMSKLEAVMYIKEYGLYTDKDSEYAVVEFLCSDCVALAMGTQKKLPSDVSTMKHLKNKLLTD